jgi:hypothetical protein
MKFKEAIEVYRENLFKLPVSKPCAKETIYPYAGTESREFTLPTIIESLAREFHAEP